MTPLKCCVLLIVAFNYFLLADGQDSEKLFRKDYDYIENTKAFYKYHKTQNEWQNAKAICESEGSALFYPVDEDELYSVLKFKNETDNDSEIFIGISAPQTRQDYQTIDGLPLTSVYHAWSPGEPNNAGGDEDCLCMYSNGLLNDNSCLKQFPFICKKTLDSIKWNDKCSTFYPGYKYSESLGSCYKLNTDAKSWKDAYKHCSNEQAHLAVINSQREADFLVKLTRAVVGYNEDIDEPQAIHLGFKEKNGKWQTIIKNKSLYKSGYAIWEEGRPGGQQCGAMLLSGRLTDVDCDQQTVSICEIDLNF